MEALELWRGLLEEGGANIKTTDHVDAVRYAKVSLTPHTWLHLPLLSSLQWSYVTSLEQNADDQNIWNATWSSIQCLSRTYPSTFANLSSETVVPLKKLIREIVDVGFEAGLLREGDRQENLKKNMGGREEVAQECWDLVCLHFLIRLFAMYTKSRLQYEYYELKR